MIGECDSFYDTLRKEQELTNREFNGEAAEVDYYSGIVDPDNPAFDSLLGALKAYSEGKADLDLLKKYHRGLTRQLEKSRTQIQEMKLSGDSEEMRSLSLGSLDMLNVAMDRLEDYIENPNPQNLGICVSIFLDARGAVTYVNKKLDKNASAAGIKQE